METSCDGQFTYTLEHVAQTRSNGKISRYIGKNKDKPLTMRILDKICLIRTILEYCVSVRGYCGEGHKHGLEALQNRAARIVARTVRSNPAMDVLKWPTLEERRRKTVLLTQTKEATPQVTLRLQLHTTRSYISFKCKSQTVPLKSGTIDKKKSKSPEKNVNLQKTQVEVDTPSSQSTHSIGQEVKAVYLVVTTACNTHVY
ncbi:unnamed protein product [Pocillopora meandrina]|uniref:Uncharacterized protein n=1 Tax=Pocillopora meandrina TaxID=46732 RepID=A0AAU9XKD8_9CNID|nr:unnamed protein product [Pocillopora meandrina]